METAAGQNERNNSVVLAEKAAEKVQSFSRVNPKKTTELSKAKMTEKLEDDGDVWRFEIKRKRRDAGRKNSGSTAKADWYYWVIRIRKSDGLIIYYGTLDILDESDPERLHKYWKRSKERKNGRTGR